MIEEFKELETPDYAIDISIREIALMLSGKPLFHITKDKKVIKMIFKHDEEDEKKDGNN